MHFAVEEGNIDIVNILVNQKDLNVSIKIIQNLNISIKFFFTKSYKTSLYMAIERNNYEIVKSLLSRQDFDINYQHILN